jgi:hypothetical protein
MEQKRMTSRERVLASIEHRQPDYLPLDDGHTRIYDVVQQVVIPEESIIDRYGVDVLAEHSMTKTATGMTSRSPTARRRSILPGSGR